MAPIRGRSLINNDITDPRDPNNYCRSCDLTFASIACFRRHIRKLHNLNKRPRPRPNPYIVPYVANVNNKHCSSCNTDYQTRNSYIRHFKVIHHLKPNPMPIHGWKVKSNRDIKPDQYDPNNCNKTYATRSPYKGHLKLVHKDIVLTRIKQHQRVNSNVQPDINDCNNYCKSCNYVYRGKYHYRSHLRKIHKMQLIRNPQKKELISKCET